MYSFQPIEIDDKEVQAKLKGTTLKMKTIAKHMMSAVNREVLKKAKKNAKSEFNINNHNLYGVDYVNEGTVRTNNAGKDNVLLMKNFKQKNLNEPFSSLDMNNSYYAGFLEAGAVINAKNGKYLTFKINGEFRKVSSVVLPPHPFLKPAVSEFWDSTKADRLMEEQLQKDLTKYWEKNSDLGD